MRYADCGTDTAADGGGSAPFCILEDGRADGCAVGRVFGTYLHGLLETDEFTERPEGQSYKRKSGAEKCGGGRWMGCQRV